jgi:hypothetical protein
MRCPRCGAENNPNLRFCQRCAAPLVFLAPPPAGPPPGRWPRWLPWAVVTGAGVVFLALLGLVVVLALPYLKPASFGQDEAVRVSNLIVERAFPQYVGAAQKVSVMKTKAGKDIYVVNYSLPKDEAHGAPFPRGLLIYFDPETRQVSIEERN